MTPKILVESKPNGHGSGENPCSMVRVAPKPPGSQTYQCMSAQGGGGGSCRRKTRPRDKAALKEGRKEKGLPPSNTQTSKNVHLARQSGLSNLHTLGWRWGHQAMVHPVAFMNFPQTQDPQRKPNCSTTKALITLRNLVFSTLILLVRPRI